MQRQHPSKPRGSSSAPHPERCQPTPGTLSGGWDRPSGPKTPLLRSGVGGGGRELRGSPRESGGREVKLAGVMREGCGGARKGTGESRGVRGREKGAERVRSSGEIREGRGPQRGRGCGTGRRERGTGSRRGSAEFGGTAKGRGCWLAERAERGCSRGEPGYEGRGRPGEVAGSRDTYLHAGRWGCRRECRQHMGAGPGCGAGGWRPPQATLAAVPERRRRGRDRHRDPPRTTPARPSLPSPRV